jgi:oxygen-independent coproporphyrinogen-3 oxidase
MLGLRTVAGIPVEWIDPIRGHELRPLLRSRLAVLRRGRLVLTSRGMELHSAIAERLIA